MYMSGQKETAGSLNRALLGEFLKRALATTNAKSVNHLADISDVSRPVVTKVRDGKTVEMSKLQRISTRGFGWNPDALIYVAMGRVDELPDMGVSSDLVSWLRTYLSSTETPDARNRRAR